MQSTYKVLKPLGQGSFGAVMKVESSATGEVFAAKVSTSSGKKLLVSESNIQSRLTHPNILQFITAFDIHHCPQNPIVPLPASVQGDCGVILLELCTGGSLDDVLKTNPVLTTRQLQLLTRQIGSGLLYLKEQGIVHRDIKPANILFCGGVAKIGDFGISKFVEDKTRGGGAGTLLFMGYESHVGAYTFATDTFALGVTLYLAYLGIYPFPIPDANDIKGSYERRRLYFSSTIRPASNRIPALENLLINMLMTEQSQRIPIKGVLKHPFTARSQSSDMDLKNDGIALQFAKLKSDFGNGTREQFYYYLANRNPAIDNMSMNRFTELWDKL
jgi:serine/threonine protein kinase